MKPEDIVSLLSVGEPEPVTDSDARVAALGVLAGRISQSPPDREAPVREVMARLGDNWSALIIQVLATGTYRHATLKRVIGAMASEGEISQRMLTLRLRALERDGFVARVEQPTQPPRVSYSLSEMGQSLKAELDRNIRWIEAHEDAIREARRVFEDHSAPSNEAMPVTTKVRSVS